MSATIAGPGTADNRLAGGPAQDGGPYFDTETGEVTLVGSGWSRTFGWGHPTWLGSAAFWVEQAKAWRRPDSYQVGRTLTEEVALCLLGGYGITELIATAAFHRVRDAGLLDEARPPDLADVEAALRAPLNLPGRQRAVRYRFPVQRAHRLADAVAWIGQNPPAETWTARELRLWLTQLHGVGPKTASWIVRNLRRSDDIAVIDVHIRRAGVFAGVFDRRWTLPQDYARYEEAFCAWAAIGEVPTADMDACIWSSLAALGNAARTLFGVARLADLD